MYAVWELVPAEIRKSILPWPQLSDERYQIRDRDNFCPLGKAIRLMGKMGYYPNPGVSDIARALAPDQSAWDETSKKSWEFTSNWDW